MSKVISKANNQAAIESNGFIVAMAPSTARRQLNISLAIAAAFIAGTILALATGQFQQRIEKPSNVKLTIQLPGTLATQQAKNLTVEKVSAAKNRGT